MSYFKRCFRFSLVLLGLWLGLKLLLPLLLPFLLGTLLALGADKGACFLCEKGHLPRGAAAGLTVSGLIAGVGLLLLLLAGLIVSRMGVLTQALPGIVDAVLSGISVLEGSLLRWGAALPQGLESGYSQAVRELFSGGTALLSKFSGMALGTAGAALSRVPGQALTLGTTVLSAFMICAKLPAIRERLSALLPKQRFAAFLSGLNRVKTVGRLWLCSQAKLMGITFCILFAGFSLLRVRFPLLVALLVTLVDALPVLGTGSILLPWALIRFLSGSGGTALGLLGLYATAALTRSVLEPKLVGHHLGLDPLVTLIAMYCGARLWGIAGMLMLPILTAAVFCALPGGGE